MKTVLKVILGLVGLVLVSVTALAADVTATISVEPLTSSKPVAPVIKWTSTGADGCVASDGWSGVKAASGQETLGVVSKTTKFTLKCTSPTGPVTLSWVPPTQWTDNSPLTGLTGYQVMTGPQATALSRGPVLGAGLSEAVIQYQPGLHYFALRTRTGTSPDIRESADSNVSSKTVVADSVTVAGNLSVEILPMPPSNFKVE